MTKKPTLSVVNESGKSPDNPASVPKPSGFSLDKFKSKRSASVANVETLPGALPHHPIAGAKDYVRLHADEAKYWSPERALSAFRSWDRSATYCI